MLNTNVDQLSYANWEHTTQNDSEKRHNFLFLFPFFFTIHHPEIWARRGERKGIKERKSEGEYKKAEAET